MHFKAICATKPKHSILNIYDKGEAALSVYLIYSVVYLCINTRTCIIHSRSHPNALKLINANAQKEKCAHTIRVAHLLWAARFVHTFRGGQPPDTAFVGLCAHFYVLCSLKVWFASWWRWRPKNYAETRLKNSNSHKLGDPARSQVRRSRALCRLANNGRNARTRFYLCFFEEKYALYRFVRARRVLC